MENNQHINNFDAMLKQSLESSQMPVPTGVWEAVGSSIGAQAIVVTKVASLKLLILKTVAGIVFSTALGFGVYQLLKSEEKAKPATIASVKNTIEPPLDLISDTLALLDYKTPETTISKSYIINEDSMVLAPIKEIEIENEESASTIEIKPIDNVALISGPTQPSETPKKVEEPEIVKPESPQIEKIETVSIPKFPEPPNVFTPDGDGRNDCFKVIVENEKLFILQIFNSEGIKVFESTDKNNCWNGVNMNTGELCKKGIYTYKYMYELNTGYKKKDSKLLTLL